MSEQKITEQNIEVKVENGVKELIIRKGDAAPVILPETLVFIGLIDAPANYFESRKHLIGKDKALVTVQRRKNTIILDADPTDAYAANVTGSLMLNQDLSEFQINSGKSFSLVGLTKFLRMRRRFFANPETHAEFMNALLNFKANINKDIERKNDNRGNLKGVVEQTTKTDLPNEFALSMPLFEGDENMKFKVEICYDIRAMEVEFTFESTELQELLEKRRDEILDAEIKRFVGLCVLEQ